MAITVTQRPSTTISGETSRWNAVGNPVIYKMTTDKYTEANYRLEVEVYNGAGTLLTAQPFQYTPNSTGLITIDISTILKNNLSHEFSGNLTGTTKVFDDSNVYLKFYIKYHEKYDGSTETQVSDSGNQFFAVNGKMSIPSTYGGNMAEYVTFTDGTPAAKFLNRISTVKMWRGYPCLVSVIVNATGSVKFDSGADETTPTSYEGKIATVDLNELITDQSIDSTTLGLYLSTTLLTESLPVQLNTPCDNPILLIGRNKLGGMLTWLFDVDQEYTFDYGNDIKAARKVLRAENLTIEDWEALQDFITLGEVYRNNIVEFTSSTIKTSTRIGQQVYAVDSSGNKIGVIVVPSKNSTRTRQIKHSFELEIEYPE